MEDCGISAWGKSTGRFVATGVTHQVKTFYILCTFRMTLKKKLIFQINHKLLDYFTNEMLLRRLTKTLIQNVKKLLTEAIFQFFQTKFS